MTWVGITLGGKFMLIWIGFELHYTIGVEAETGEIQNSGGDGILIGGGVGGSVGVSLGGGSGNLKGKYVDFDLFGFLGAGAGAGGSGGVLMPIDGKGQDIWHVNIDTPIGIVGGGGAGVEVGYSSGSGTGKYLFNP